ncbi:MAG: basic secretory protein-like protein [Pirellulales bacterium]
MRSRTTFVAGASIVLLFAAVSHAEVQTVVESNGSDTATPAFKFKNVPAPSRTDAATTAKFTVVDGRRDSNGGDVETLRDGRVPGDEDQPAENFFFGAGSEGGRLLVDLGAITEVRTVNTYSWHSSTRGPQVYKLYAADGSAAGFNAQPKQGTDPEKCGWKLLAGVDTRPEQGQGGGQYGVSVRDSGGVLGKYRYLLFDVSRTEAADPFGNTFYSEIDIDDGKPREAATPPAPEPRREIVEADGGTYQITIDTTEAPDLTQWVHEDLAPVVRQWYPKLVKMLPSEGYEAPKKVTITFSASMRGVAATGGTRIGCAAGWMRQNLKGEAKGAIVHELVHVVQQYGRARRAGPNAAQAPGWLVEGIPDYIRWFLYEPETRGAEITGRSIARARYDASYRVSGNFLNWVTKTYDKELVVKLNAAAREGRYREDLWKQYTGHTLQELGAEWKADLEKTQGAAPAATEESKINTLTDEEKKAGWKLLITPEKCEHAINGVKYFDYVLGSDDFKQRVANSKFGAMPLFAKSDTGYIVLQGDHGEVSFRNIKIRPIEAKASK